MTCHEAGPITASTGHTHEQWDHLIRKVIELPAPEASKITQYLAVNFPLTHDRRPTLVAGDALRSEDPTERQGVYDGEERERGTG